ncbi:PAAR/RHS domain-containing protein [Paracoccus caeni]|uniref:PAAR/RHS domain-containing protein n=1 Tax=Paracoccus caeni TaxID=657651 RepID=A0A934SF24_9RHOB|nr:RHS repeat-associated core domain-containing protein [Paracoccus caeni]MBK4217701.1 PAAR/RHS domain-containing protein [Paracoccus caeni]
MSGGMLAGMTSGAYSAQPTFGNQNWINNPGTGPVGNPTGGGTSTFPEGLSEYQQQALGNAATQSDPGAGAHFVDGIIDSYNSGPVQALATYGPIAAAGVGGAITASAAGATGMALAGAAAAAALPVAVATAAGLVYAQIGFGIGEGFGHWAMDAMGFERIAEDGEMPATVGHPIAHAETGWSLGAMVLGAVAAVAVAALVVATAGAASVLVVAFVAGASAGLVGGIGFGFASAAGQYGSNKGVIKKGSANVKFNNKSVARVSDLVDCDDHAESFVAEGAETVFANNLPIARIGHKTTCNGTINDGLTNIAIDIDTSAIALPIDRGWAERITDLGLIVLDWLPIGGRRPRGGDPATNRGGDLPNSCRSTCGDPIDVATGQFVDLRTDIFIPGTIPLRLDRCHSVTAGGSQGRGWSGTWAQHLRIDGETVTFQSPEGSQITFHAPQDEVVSHNLRFPHLELLGRRSADLFLYDRPARLFYVFADEGGALRRLSRIEDRNGNRITFLYDDGGLHRVEHSDGFALQVHSERGLIRHAALQAADADECVFSWDYTRDGRLKEVQSSQTGTMRYDHDAEGRITAWHDAKDTHVHYEYGEHGRIVRTWTDSGHMSGQIDYDLRRKRTVYTSAQGEATAFDWDEDGLVWRLTDPLGHVWLTEWDRALHVTARVDPLGNRSEFTYDAFGNLTRHKNAEGVVISFDHDASGQLLASTDAMGNRTEFRHDERGNLVGLTDALGRVTTMGLGLKGELLRIDLPGGVQERIYYDPLLRPSRRRDPDGNETLMGYDTEGRLRWYTDEIGATTRYDMTRGAENPRGALRMLETPDGAISTLSWDIEGQLRTITDPNGTSRHFRFGAFDLPVETVDAKGHRLRLEHDPHLRLSAVVNELGERYEYAYDAVGNLTAERDYSGRVTRYNHDAVGRVIQKIATNGTRTDFTYSPSGLLLSQRIEGEAETRFTYDPSGMMIRVENGAAVVEYDYDALGRVVAERLNGREITSEYSVAGQRIARSGDVLHLTAGWTRAGLPTELGIGDHAPLAFHHDPRGLEQLRSSPTGFALAQGHTIMGQLSEQMAGPLARLPEEARRGGLGHSIPVEMATRIGARAHRSYDWDKLGRAISVNDRVMGLVRFDYDQRGQVTTTRRDTPDGQSALSHFEYDPARNIAAVIEAGRTVPVESNAGRIKRRGTVSYRHDDCGRVIEKRVEEPGFRPRVWHMDWDGQDQLSAVTTPDGTVWRYTYDPLGRRIARASGSQGYAYQWEGDRLIAEAPMTANGEVAWDSARHWVYEPGSFRPLAQIDGEVLHYVVTDHLGTPRELFSEDGTEVAWRSELGLWGDIAELRLPRPANDNEAPADCPIRFQGQWEDAETGLYYNRFRYYDPEATQYLSPDPIGLAGGVRPQGYVADPNGWVDPLGLAPITPGDFGLGTITDDPVLHRLWIDAMKDAAAAKKSNGYTRLLELYDQGKTPTTKQLEAAFKSVNDRFLSSARNAGYTIAQTHHWNYNKGSYPTQIVDPRHLVPTPSRAVHQQIHQATTSNPSKPWAGPIADEHRINIPDHSTPLPPRPTCK